VSHDIHAEARVKSARSLLEKIAGESDGEIAPYLDELRAQISTLPPHELALAQAMGWIQGIPDIENLRPEDFASNRLKAAYFSSPRCHRSLCEVIKLGLTPKGNVFLKCAKSRVELSEDDELADASQFVVEQISTHLSQGDRKQATKLIKSIAMEMRLPVSASQSQYLLETVYAQFDPNKRSTWPKQLVEFALDWLTLPKNKKSLDHALSASTVLTPASYGNLIMALSRIPVIQDSSKFVLLSLLVKPRERPLVSALAQVGVFDAFSSDEFGTMISEPSVEKAALDNQRVGQNLRDAVNRRLRKDHPVEALLATARYQRLSHWCDTLVLARRIGALGLPVLDALVSELVERDVNSHRMASAAELEELKAALSLSESRAKNLEEEVQSTREVAKSWEDRLRENVNAGRGAREEELRVAQATAVRELIDLLDEAQRSSESKAAIDSLVQHRRRGLSNFGVRVDGKEGDEVVYDPRLHNGIGIEPGSSCRLESPVYTVVNTTGEIVLKKGSVSLK